MSASKQDVQDFEFIISEAIRIKDSLRNEDFKSFMAQEYNEAFDSIGMMIETPNVGDQITLKDPRRQINLSYLSRNKITEIARRKIKSYKLEMLITVSEFHQELRDSIYNHVLLMLAILMQMVAQR